MDAPTPASDPYGLARFVRAQDGAYDAALAELRAGQKHGHWIWYVFPQLRGLGRSEASTFYGLSGADEAAAYAAHPVLGPRLADALDALAETGRSAEAVLGGLDALKLRSCLTLFARAIPADPRYASALARFFGGTPDPLTRALLDAPRG